MSALVNNSMGTHDRQGRGCILPHIHEYIRVKAPTCFLLENVQGMTTHKHKDAFANVLSSLRGGLDNNYMVSWRVVNTADFGLPQNRPRLYIIGMRRDALQDRSRFVWPRPVGCVPLASILGIWQACTGPPTQRWHNIREESAHTA